MRTRSLCATLWLLAIPAALVAQHRPGAAPTGPPIHVAPPEAAQFDFLVGHWEVEARPRATGLAQRIHGAPRILGTWKAWRALDGFGIEDELRLLDGSGNPISLSYAIRAFDPTARKWTQTTLDVYRGRFTPAEGEWRNGEMHVTSRGTDPEGQAYVARTRFFDITPTGFRFQQDRSTDNGRTWTDAVLRMEVKRIAATAPR